MNTAFRLFLVPSVALGLASAEAAAGAAHRDSRHAGAAIGAVVAGIALGAAIAGASRHRQPMDVDADEPAPTYAQYPYGYDPYAEAYPRRRRHWQPPAYEADPNPYRYRQPYGYQQPYAYPRGYGYRVRPHDPYSPGDSSIGRGSDGSVGK